MRGSRQWQGNITWEPRSYSKESGWGQRSQANSELHFGYTTSLSLLA